MSVKFENHCPEAKRGMRDAIPTALEICGGVAESYAKRLCPVDTGNLRNSITHQQIDDKTEAIGTNVYYAPYVELGTMRMSAKPYLRPAVDNHKNEYREIIDRVLKR